MKDEQNNRISRLFQLYLLGDITPQEQKELEAWCDQNESNRLFFENIQKENLLAQEHELYKNVDKVKAFSTFKQKTHVLNKKHKTVDIISWKYAAIFLLPLAIAAVLWTNFKPEETPIPQQVAIHSGASQALLILENGQKVALTSGDGNDSLIKNSNIVRKKDELIYTSTKQEQAPQEIRFNELIIPKGGEYKVTLSDGTVVYLNSVTHLKYPTTFGDKERRVQLDGEAYFEVTKDSQHPFIVEVNGVEVKVYGTSFNVNSQQDHKIQTVLVEGSIGIKIQSSGEEQIISPGEMAVFDEIPQNITIKKVNPQVYTDWRNGIFRFENERLEDILNKLANWYDVEIFYQSPDVKELHFTGYIERYKKIDTILRSITLATNVQFSIREKTILVSK